MPVITIRSSRHTEFINIDRQIQAVLESSGVQNGLVHVFVPHTTAGITINENADPDVVRDMIAALERAVPWSAAYAHSEGNAAAHVKASLMGFAQTIPVENGRLAFGTWQSLYFCEFDGPRTRQVHIQIMPQT